MPATPTPLRPPEWANRCGCAGSHGSCSHDPAAPTPDNGLGGCGECEPHSDATPTPNAAPDITMSDACSSSVEVSPEAALQGLVGALRARHDPPPGQRAVTTNGWHAVDELELIMRRWRATLDRGKKSEVTVGKRKADACRKHFSRLRSDLHERLPPQIVEAICNVTAEQLSPDPVRIAVIECTDPEDSKRAAALKARMDRCGDGVDDPAVADDDIAAAINLCLSTCDRSRRGSAEPWTEQEDRQLLHAFWLSLADPTAPLKSAMIMSVSSRLRSQKAVEVRLNQLRSRLPPHVAARALPSRQKQLQTSRWLELAERCCNPQTRPSGPQQNDAAVAKAARAAIADDENLDDAGKRALRRAAGGVPLQRLPLSGLASNHMVPPMRIEEGSVVSLQQRDGKRIDHGRVPTAAQYGPSARQVRIPEKWHLRINDTRFFLLDANSDLARLRHTTYNVLDIQSGTSIADLLSNVSAWLDRCQP